MYKVYKKVFTFTPEIEKYIIEKSKKGTPIFNNKYDNDKKRIQYDIEEDTVGITNQLQKIVNDHGYKGIVNDPVIIKSLSYCKRQQLHTDYDVEKIKMNEYPHGIIVGCSDGCRFIVGTSKKYIHFDKGDVIIFRGDTVHAGSEYYTENIRLHAYIDVPTHERIKNETFPLRSF